MLGALGGSLELVRNAQLGAKKGGENMGFCMGLLFFLNKKTGFIMVFYSFYIGFVV